MTNFVADFVQENTGRGPVTFGGALADDAFNLFLVYHWLLNRACTLIIGLLTNPKRKYGMRLSILGVDFRRIS